MRSGLKTPMAEIPTPDLAVPYAAPKQVKTIAEVQPIAPKNGCERRSASIDYDEVVGAGQSVDQTGATVECWNLEGLVRI
jgi:hypothetical protein